MISWNMGSFLSNIQFTPIYTNFHLKGLGCLTHIAATAASWIPVLGHEEHEGSPPWKAWLSHWCPAGRPAHLHPCLLKNGCHLNSWLSLLLVKKLPSFRKDCGLITLIFGGSVYVGVSEMPMDCHHFPHSNGHKLWYTARFVKPMWMSATTRLGLSENSRTSMFLRITIAILCNVTIVYLNPPFPDRPKYHNCQCWLSHLYHIYSGYIYIYSYWIPKI